MRAAESLLPAYRRLAMDPVANDLVRRWSYRLAVHSPTAARVRLWILKLSHMVATYAL